MRLIDVDKLHYIRKWFCDSDKSEVVVFAKEIDKKANAIVCCKDCKYYHKAWDGTETHHYTDYWCEWVEPEEDDYCSLAERKENEAD